MLYDAIADFELSIEEYELDRLERDTSSGFTRATTVITLRGAGTVGRGEDVTYETDAHDALQAASEEFPVVGEFTLESFSERLAEIDLFPEDEPTQPVFRNYRRWGFESAALDLALRQADLDLATALDRDYQPVRFVVSTRLADPPTGERIHAWLERNPDLEFKLDPTSDWTTDLIENLAATGAVRTLDLKGQYHGTTVDQAADPVLYERVIDGFPEAVIEDPALDDETWSLFDGEEHRVSWDYPIRSVATIEELPWQPAWLNIKPSRFGSVRTLFETIDYCRANGIQLYGGGQFELGIGREQLHALASLWYPDAPNDVAPTGYNEPTPRDGLPKSPLTPPADPHGFAWGR